MKVEVYIKTDKFDYNDELNLEYSLRDYLSTDIVKNNSSFAINLPLTENNIELTKHLTFINSSEEVSDFGTIRIDDSEVLSGVLRVLEIEDTIKIVITSNNWVTDIINNTLKDLDLSAHDHVMTEAVMNASDSASNAFYRYPLINWGIMAKGEDSPSVGVAVGDRLPVFQVWDIYEAILAPYTIITNMESILDEIYITTDIPYADEDFIEQGYFRAEVDPAKTYTDSVPAPPASYPVGVFSGSDNRTMEYDDEIDDLGTNYNDSTFQFTVPTDGVYRFICSVQCGVNINTYLQATVNPTITVEIIADSVSIASTVDTSISGYGTTIIEVISDYEYLEASDVVYVKITVEDTVDNTHPTDAQDYEFVVYSSSGDTYFKSVPTIYFGKNFPVTISDFIPAIPQMEFIKAVNHLFGIVMWIDEQSKKVYMYSYNDFYSTNVVDWSDKIDHKKRINQKIISANLSKYYTLRFKDDSNDLLLSEYNAKEDDHLGSKNIELSSEYVINQRTILENTVFSSFIVGNFSAVDKDTNNVLTQYSSYYVYDDIPIIWGNKDHELTGGIMRPSERIKSFNVKIMQWDGLQAGNWTFEGTGKATFPKVSQIDYSDMYDDYLWHEFKRLDQGKIIIPHLILSPKDINPFYTLVDTADQEGFRAKYKLKYRDEVFYAYVHRIVYNGERAKIEFIKAT